LMAADRKRWLTVSMPSSEVTAALKNSDSPIRSSALRTDSLIRRGRPARSAHGGGAHPAIPCLFPQVQQQQGGPPGWHLVDKRTDFTCHAPLGWYLVDKGTDCICKKPPGILSTRA
jgi:hypothetical protein